MYMKKKSRIWLLLIFAFSLNCETIYAQNETLTPFQYNGNWGFIDNEANVVIDPVYSNITPSWDDPFSENGLAAVEANGKWGYINRNGETVIPFKYDYARKFSKNGLAAVKIDENVSYIDEAGEVILPNISKYTMGVFSDNGLASVSNDQMISGYMN